MSDNKKPDVIPKMRTPLTVSLVVHGIILLLVIFGLPYFKKDIEIIDPVPIEMVTDVSELTTSNKPPVKAQPVNEPKEEKPPPKVEEKPQTQQEPPKVEPKPEPPKPVKEEPKIVQPEEKPDELGELKKKDPPKEDTKPKDETPKEDPKDFDKLLKNLSDEKPTPTSEEETDDQQLMTDPSPSPNVSRMSDTLSVSETDALRQQLAGCWNIPPGGLNAQDITVEVRVIVNQDRTVASAEIVDTARLNSDTFFRSMAESALRAVQNPRCSPLRLPPEKYSLWNKMTIVFDPKEMF